MATRSTCSAFLVCALVCLCGTAIADDSGGFCEVVEVTPSRPIDHEVDLKGPFDAQVTETYLEGPLRFSHSVGFGQDAAQKPSAYLNWYKIRRAVAEPRRVLTVRDSLRGNQAQQMVIQNATFLLAPTQRITSGPPSQIPAELSSFKAYEITSAREKNRKVVLSGGFGPDERVIVRATYLCVPVEVRHHDDRFPIKRRENCMLVFEMQTETCSIDLTTLDLFGMHELEATSSNWICIPAQIVEGPSEEDR